MGGLVISYGWVRSVVEKKMGKVVIYGCTL